MEALDSEYWNCRYLNGETGWDTGGITTPLKEYFDQLTDKTQLILIPGAGNAYEAEYLFNNGFTGVYVIDLAPAPLQNLKDRCPAMPSDHLILGDFFQLNTEDLLNGRKFGLIVEQTFFCALDPSLRKQYFEKASSLLRRGGRLVGLLFNDPLGENGPPFGGNQDEYREYFKDLFDIKTYEIAYNSIKPRVGREIFVNLSNIK